MQEGLVLREDIVMTASGAQELGPDLEVLFIAVSVCIGLLCVLGLPLLGCCCPPTSRSTKTGGVWAAPPEAAGSSAVDGGRGRKGRRGRGKSSQVRSGI